MRKYHNAPPPSIQLADIKDVNSVTQIREYQLITPLFGGGVEAGKNDTITPIRGTAIRGQLRFWWRASRGGQSAFEGQLAKMKEAEARIWGTATLTKKQSHQKIQDVIQIRVEMIQAGVPKESSDRSIHPYAAFPLLSKEKKLKAREEPELKTVQDNISFRLIITFPKQIERKVNDQIIIEEIAPEVEATLWAWETFGGVGARTRRGFGALKCIRLIENGQEQERDEPPAQPLQAQEWLQRHLNIHRVTGTWPKHVPHLNKELQETQNFYLLQPKQYQRAAKDVWYTLINNLRDFRQMRRGNKYGRSLWPEADVIRALMKQQLPKRPIFPRAAFGLPIIFHFQQARTEPTDTTLQVSEKEERMASPLILRPLACQGNAYLGLALVLAGYDIPNPQTSIILKKQQSDGHNTQKPPSFNVLAQINTNEARMIDPLNGDTNVLAAFLKSMKSPGAK